MLLNTIFVFKLIFIWSFSIFIFETKSETKKEYFARRNALLEEEANYMLGGNLKWESDAEKRVNDIIMSYKRKEYNEGLDGTNGAHFLSTSRHYFHVMKLIEKSNVFKIIKILPKGAALHNHDISTGSVEYTVQELTHWKNLYMCYLPRQEDYFIQFRFFQSTPTTHCALNNLINWTLVSDFRRKASSSGYVDNLFYRVMDFDTETPESDYRDNNEAWAKFAKQMSTVTGILGYVEALKAYYDYFLQAYYDDNVMYVEVRGRLENVYQLDQTILNEKQTLAIYEEVTREFKIKNPKFIGAKYILSALRNYSPEKMTKLVHTVVDLKRSYPNFFAGFDLVFHENIGKQNIAFISQLLHLSNNGIKFFFHAGETDWHNTKIDDNIMDAVLLNSTRIGHGTALNGRPYIVDMIFEKKIGLEVNPISGQVLRLFQDFRAHPDVPLLRKDFPIVIGNDDGGMWRDPGLSYDFYHAFMGMGGERADLRFLKQLALNSINYSAMSSREKKFTLKEWKLKWEFFLIQVLTKFPLVLESKDIDIKWGILWTFQKESPLTATFDRIKLQALAGDLFGKWMKDDWIKKKYEGVHWIKNQSKSELTNNIDKLLYELERNGPMALGIHNLFSIFVILILGLGLAILLWIGEIFYFYRWKWITNKIKNFKNALYFNKKIVI